MKKTDIFVLAVFVLTPALSYAEPAIEEIAVSAETQIYEMRTDFQGMPVLTPFKWPDDVADTKEPEKIPPSKSYSGVAQNNDGSTTIFKPVFRSPDGKTGIPFSAQYSELDGICRLYGYGEAHTKVSGAIAPLTANINSQGRLSGFTGYVNGIDLLVCDPAKDTTPERPAPEKRAESVSKNDDGSFTVYRPYLLGPDNSKMPITSVYSDKIGVCRYFGFNGYVAHIASPESSVTTFDINKSGYISGVTTYASGIESIVCRK